MKNVQSAYIVGMGEAYPKIVDVACSNAHIIGLIETRGYSAIASCVIEHIITNSDLKESERLYYLLADLYANYNRSQHTIRTTTLPGAIWEKRLNMCEEYVFVLQKSLEAKGYFHIQRNKFDNQNEINVITPTLPPSVFEELKHTQTRNNLKAIPAEEQQRCYLDDTKMFVKFNNKQIELLIQNESITPLQKLIWVFLYMRSLCSFQSTGDWRSTITQRELAQIFKCSQSTASKALSSLEDYGFITKYQSRIKDASTSSNRRKKSIWFVEALFPLTDMQTLLQQKARANINLKDEYVAALYQPVDNINCIPTVKADFSAGSPDNLHGSPQFAQSSVSSIKDITTKSIFIKNNKQQTCTSPDVTDVYFENKTTMQKFELPQELSAPSLLDIDVVEIKFQRNIEKLSPEQVRKAVNFAKKLKREKLCSADLIDVSELELARQFVHHAANFKMTRLACKDRGEEVEAALSFAWNAAKTGKWRCPAGWGAAFDLHLEREKHVYQPHNSPEVCRFEGKIKRYLDS